MVRIRENGVGNASFSGQRYTILRKASVKGDYHQLMAARTLRHQYKLFCLVVWELSSSVVSS